MTTRHPHNRAYAPPFPEVDVTLLNEDSDLDTETLPALLDTGADTSLVPIHHLRHLQAHAFQEAFVRSHWGERQRVHLFRIDIRLNGVTLPGISVIGDERGSEVILGRDVLNRLRLFLDGPGRTTDILL